MNINDFVLIIVKGENKTSEIKSCQYNASTKRWDIVFNNDKMYSYSYENVVKLEYNDKINPADISIKHGKQHLDNIKSIWSFKDKNSKYEYWKVKYNNGSESVYDRKNLEVTVNCLLDKKSNNTFNYLRELSGLFDSVKNDMGENVLEKRVSNISYIGENSALALYLNKNTKINMSIKPPQFLVFPFGCNNSQYKAVDIAMRNRISVIQGPPGTGKTQTILNLIANIVIQGKTVLVVSSNNSAIENVLEKISDPNKDIGFIAAELGKAENKRSFIFSQSGEYPDFQKWNLKTGESGKLRDIKVIRENLNELKDIFEKEEKLAELKNVRSKISTEYKYFEDFIKDNISDILSLKFKENINSKKWLELWNGFQWRFESGRINSFIYKLKMYFSIRGDAFYLLKHKNAFIIQALQYNYYISFLDELDKEIEELSDFQTKKERLMKSLQGDSLELLRYSLFDRYKGSVDRTVFTEDDLWKNPEQVLSEYPVILSTTFSSTTSLNKNIMYDYIIMDEASQVDVVTGSLALSCAKNAVIVGDMMQLPNVVSGDDKSKADSVFAKYNISEGYRYTKSFLESIMEIIPDVEYTLLREHYRCHPKIINFCNQRFYNNELIIMTEDKGEKDVIVAYKTSKGNHSRDKYSERQIDVIKNEVVPIYAGDKENTGIIAPYRNQVKALRESLEGYEVDTVHKYQGREKDTIIISTVDDELTDFVDDPNLINVAVSRAKKRLILVSSGNEQRKDSNVSALLDYIEYNNFEVHNSTVYSVFDYLYKQYRTERAAFLSKHRRISEFDSENLLYSLLEDILGDRKFSSYDALVHYPINNIIKSTVGFSDREIQYAMNPLTHLDFLIYNKMNKSPILAIEVDGVAFHKKGSKQAERDELKNNILDMMGLPLIRLKTNESNERSRIVKALDSINNW